MLESIVYGLQRVAFTIVRSIPNGITDIIRTTATKMVLGMTDVLKAISDEETLELIRFVALTNPDPDGDAFSLSLNIIKISLKKLHIIN